MKNQTKTNKVVDLIYSWYYIYIYTLYICIPFISTQWSQCFRFEYMRVFFFLFLFFIIILSFRISLLHYHIQQHIRCLRRYSELLWLSTVFNVLEITCHLFIMNDISSFESMSFSFCTTTPMWYFSLCFLSFIFFFFSLKFWHRHVHSQHEYEC